MDSLFDASLRRLSALGWAALLPVVMLVCTSEDDNRRVLAVLAYLNA